MQQDFQVFLDAEDDIMEDADAADPQQMKKSDSRKAKKEDLTFEIDSEWYEKVKETCIMNQYPLIEEYDFKLDTDQTRSPDLNIELKSSTIVRSYQE